MMRRDRSSEKLTTGLILLPAMLPLTGCVAVGYSSRGGLFVWPGGVGMVLLILVVFLLLRRR